LKSREKYFSDGFISDRLDNYSDLFNVDMLRKLKLSVDNSNIYKGSRYIYEYGFDGNKINELLFYDKVQTNIGKDVDPSNKLSDKHTDILFQLGHEHIVNKINDSRLMGGDNAWILGEANDFIYGKYMDNIMEQQIKFTKYYYEYYKNHNRENFSLGNTLVQFYSKGCFIGKHNDGSPSNRICTFLYFLNTDWKSEDGGQLVINPDTDDEVVVEPIFPNFVVLDQSKNCVDNIHEVRKVNDNIKLTLTSFFELS